MTWCSTSKIVIFNKHGLTTCGCETLQFLIASTYLSLFSYYYLRVYSKFINKFLHIDEYTNLMYRILFIGSLFQSILSIISAINQSFSIVLILSTIIQSIGWIISAYNIHLDVWYVPIWPNWIIKIFFTTEMLILLLSAATLYSSNQTTYQLFIGAVSFIIVVLLLILSLFKDSWRNREEKMKCDSERMIYGTNVTSSVPLISYEEDDIQTQSRNSFLFPERMSSSAESTGILSSIGFKLPRMLHRNDKTNTHNPYEAVIDTTEQKLKQRKSGIFSFLRWKSNRSNEKNEREWDDIGSDYEHFRDDSYISDRNSITSQGKVSPKASMTSQPLVKSALERHLDSANGFVGRNSLRSHSTPSDRLRDGPSSSSSSSSTAIAGGDSGSHRGSPRDSFTDRSSIGRNSIGKQSNHSDRSSEHKSGALQRALDMQRARLSANGNQKSSGSGRGFTSMNSSLSSSSLISRQLSQPMDGFGGGGSSGNGTLSDESTIQTIHQIDSEYYVIIQQWILRQNSKLSPPRSLSNDDNNGNSNNNNNNNSNYSIGTTNKSSSISREDDQSNASSIEGKCNENHKIDNNKNDTNLTTRNGSDRSQSPTPLLSLSSSSTTTKLTSTMTGNPSTPSQLYTHRNSLISTGDLEFEICVHQGSETNHSYMNSESERLTSTSDSDSTDVTSGRLRHNKRPGLWTLWKTSDDVFSLHTALLSTYGDDAPRRPKIKCVNIAEGGKVTHHDMASDMRAITVFLNAILRDSNFVQNSSVRNFFRLAPIITTIDTNLVSTLTSSSTTTGPTLSQISRGTSEEVLDSQITNLNQSIDDSITSVVSMEAKGIASTNQQDKWRKLYVNLRVKIKPHEIGVRCYLFEGVVSGSEIAAWLIRPSDNSSSGSSSPNSRNSNQLSNTSYNQLPRDRVEACALGQELLNCGLINAVSCGFDEDGEDGSVGYPDNIHHAEDNSSLSITHPSQVTATAAATAAAATTVSLSSSSSLSDKAPSNSIINSNVNSQAKKRFSDKYGYIYRFRETSSTAKAVGSWTLFGSVVKISIPGWSYAEEEEEIEPITSRDTMGVTVKNNGVIAVMRPSETIGGENAINGVSKTSKAHVIYGVKVSHGDDHWEILKRYRQFEQFHRMLLKEGIRSEIQLPPKQFTKALGRQANDEAINSRRVGLEAYLQSMIEAVLLCRNEKALEIAAQFLDDDYNKLRIV